MSATLMSPSEDLNSDARYAAFADRLVRTGLVMDPWIDGRPRFSSQPALLNEASAHELASAAGNVVQAHHELVRFVNRHPGLLDSYFRLTDSQRAMFLASTPNWHAHARADVFRCTDGSLKICELNCDTPSGWAEAVALAQVADGKLGADPNAALSDAFIQLVRRLCSSYFPGRSPRIGIVYPTELTEDLGLIAFWREAFGQQGWSVVLGSPFNLGLSPNQAGVALMGQRCDVILRHYKTDWWGERQPIWSDEADYPDPAPLEQPLSLLLAAQRERRCVVLNPFGAVLAQNKRTMAFLWDNIENWTAETAATVRAFVPQTCCLDRMDSQVLIRERTKWVLKSNYGCEGEDVLVGQLCSDEDWALALERARPECWVVQRRFDPALDSKGRQTNHGVFVIGGEPVGIYTRVSNGPTDYRALSVATLVSDAETLDENV